MSYQERSISDFWKVDPLEVGENDADLVNCLYLAPIGNNIDLDWGSNHISTLLRIFKENKSTTLFIIDLRIRSEGWLNLRNVKDKDGSAERIPKRQIKKIQDVVGGLSLALASGFSSTWEVNPHICFISDNHSFRSWLSERLPEPCGFNLYVISSRGRADVEIAGSFGSWLRKNTQLLLANYEWEVEDEVFRDILEREDLPDFPEGVKPEDVFGDQDDEESGCEGFQKLKTKHRHRK